MKKIKKPEYISQEEEKIKEKIFERFTGISL